MEIVDMEMLHTGMHPMEIVIKEEKKMPKGFTRLVYKQGCEEWENRIARISQVCNVAEVEMVVQDKRRAATIHISQDNLDSILPKLNSKGLIFTPLRKSGYYVGFSHTHKQVLPGDPFYWYGCVTRNYEDGQVFLKADKDGNHNAIAEMLAFPACCGEYFTREFPKNYDPVWTDLEGDVEGYPECNNMLRYFGIRAVWHFSCSPKCEETCIIAQKWKEIMEGIDKDAVKDLYSLLSGEITWNSYHGVVEVETPYFVGVTHTFPFDKPRIIRWRGI